MLRNNSNNATHQSNSWGVAPTPATPPPEWGPGVITVTRESHEPGLGMTIEHLVLISVRPESPAGRAGVQVMLGRRITHINDQPVRDNFDIERLTQGPIARFRFSPLVSGTSEEHMVNTINKLKEQGANMTLRRRHRDVPLGIDLREPGLTLETIDAKSPAADAGLQRFIGHQLTHANGRYVTTTTDVMLASEGLTTVELRFKPHICGVTVVRATERTPWGFSVGSLNLEVMEVYPNSPGDRAGLENWINHKVTHVNGKHIKSSHDLVEIMKSPAKELQIRLSPWSSEEEAEIPSEGLRQEDVKVNLRPGTGLGMALSTIGLILEKVQPGSPADEAALLPAFKGWKLSHVNGQAVKTVDEVGELAYSPEAPHAWFRFQQLTADTVVSPDTIASDNINVQKYREWLKRRSSDRDRANSPPASHPGLIHLPKYSSPLFLSSTGHKFA